VRLIILDTNILPRDGSLAGQLMVLLRAIAAGGNESLALPEIVVHESEHCYSRALEAAWEKAKKANAELTKILPRFARDPQVTAPNIPQYAEVWREELKKNFQIISSPPGAAEDALQREAKRRRPAGELSGKGVGARDTLIWLTVLDALRSTSEGENIFFISNNPNDFGRGSLFPELLAEIDQLNPAGRLLYMNTIPDLLAALAPDHVDGPSIDQLARSPVVKRAVESIFAAITTVSGANWVGTGYHTRAVETTLAEVADTGRSYVVGGRSYAVAKTIWDVTASFVVSSFPRRSTIRHSTIVGPPGFGGWPNEQFQDYRAEFQLLLILEDDIITSAEVLNPGEYELAIGGMRPMSMFPPTT
jgi:hypothetical protein